jgi:hypothetical protein
MDKQRQDDEFYDKAKERFVAWSAMSPAERKMMSLPGSRAAWAKQSGVSERAVASWATEFASQIEELKVQKVVQSGGQVQNVVEDYESLSNAEIFADLVRKQLLRAARGDDNAMNWLRANQQVLKPLVDALNDDFASDFEQESDEVLIERFLGTFEAEVVMVLRSRGWSVDRDAVSADS